MPAFDTSTAPSQYKQGESTSSACPSSNGGTVCLLRVWASDSWALCHHCKWLTFLLLFILAGVKYGNVVENGMLNYNPVKYTTKERKERVVRWQEKRKRRNFSKKVIKYENRKNLAHTKLRKNGRFVRKQSELLEPPIDIIDDDSGWDQLGL
jgi:hypothetical protein